MLADIDGRVETTLELNSSLTKTYVHIADNMASQQATIESEWYIESYGVLRTFVRNVVRYANADLEVTKSSLIDTGQ